jgi:Holliday junction resolvase RusA-like endonuclease
MILDFKNPTQKLPVFLARLRVQSHVIKKNRREIMLNRRTGRRFLGKSKELLSSEKILTDALFVLARQMSLKTPITQDVHVVFKFYFSDFYTKEGKRRKNLPDLTNLIQLPEDCLQSAGIIENDSQIVSLDGSRRLPGNQNFLEIFVYEADNP